MYAVGSKMIEYEQIAEHLDKELKRLGINPVRACYDRWRMNLFKPVTALYESFSYVEWTEVGQGFKDMSPCIETFEGLCLDGKLHHGGHPLLTMAASSAIAVMDPAGNRKLDKSKASRRIDPLVAAVMGAHFAVHAENIDTANMIA
jgi:phage terminase large subunit-like protein